MGQYMIKKIEMYYFIVQEWIELIKIESKDI